MKRKHLLFYGITILFGLLVSAALGEILVRFLSPQPYMYPRFQYSEKYGALVYPNVEMIDAWPGRFEFRYTINEQGFRGPAVAISTSYDKRNILILGDSNAFGKGVNDGDEFAQVMQRLLAPEYHVVNLGMIGFGLTQQIRSFYEFGLPYQPKVVILQFCDNDPGDNIENAVTDVVEGKLVFRPTNNARSMQLRTANSRSFIQKSQLYNFLRFRVLLPAYNFVRTGTFGIPAIRTDSLETASANESRGIPVEASIDEEQVYYNKLLETFARDLKQRKIRLIMISVNGQLRKFRVIAEKVQELDRAALLEYAEVERWFDGITGYGSAEGHVWGAKGHRIVGEGLAGMIRTR